MDREIEFRSYYEPDLSLCAGIGVQVFPVVTGGFAGKEISQVMEGQVDSCHAVCNYHELAVVDGAVVGLIFGWVSSGCVVIDGLRRLRRLLSIPVRFLLGRYGSRRKLIRYFGPCLQAVRVARRNAPGSQAEVVLFAVSPGYQGLGIGRALMDRFVHHASKCKARVISVTTDETLSFRFYERYGFRRWAEYRDVLTSYCSGGRSIKGFIYRLLLPEANGLAPE